MDSCADFAPGVAEALGVEIVHFTYVMSGKEYADDLWRSMTPKEFYDRMRAGETATTSAVTPGHYLEHFERAAEEGTPTVYLAFTRGLSSSIDAARQAAEMVRESHPGFEYVVDNVCPSAAAELLAIEAVRQAANGLSAKELVAWAEEARYYVHGYFTLESFDALARGGRIPPAAATVGGKLDIKPELSYDTSGALTLRGMCRGRKKALRADPRRLQGQLSRRGGRRREASDCRHLRRRREGRDVARRTGAPRARLLRRARHLQLRGAGHRRARGPRHGGAALLGRGPPRGALVRRPRRAAQGPRPVAVTG